MESSCLGIKKIKKGRAGGEIESRGGERNPGRKGTKVLKKQRRKKKKKKGQMSPNDSQRKVKRTKDPY